jgi:tRNA threonylcarbamoyladenosine biosynthesis protein TsaB
MILLAIETSGATLSLALYEEGALLLELSAEAAMRQNESLAPLASTLLQRCERKASQLGAVAVSLGPGSFTGLRTGLAFAKGLCYATGAVLVGIPTLEAWAEGAGQVEVWLDARRGLVYRGAFDKGRELKEGAMISLLQAKDELPQGFVVHSDMEGLASPGAPTQPSASRVGRLALIRLASGKKDDAATTEPIYLRRPEAEILWEKRHGA